MSIYHYNGASAIDEVTFKESEGGHIRAYVHAVPNADPQVLEDIKSALNARHWQATPYSTDSKPLLEVQGFNSEKEFNTWLKDKDKGWIQGAGRFFPTKKEKFSTWEQIKKRSLGASGLAYVVGDAAYTTYGYKDGSRLNLAGGLLYGAGTASLLVGGRKDPSDLQIRDIAKLMAKHVREAKIELPENCSLMAISEDYHKGIIQKADDLWRRYPSELMNLFFAAAGGCIAVAAYKSLGHKIDKNSEAVTQVLDRLRKKNPSLTREFVHEKMQINHKREGWLDVGLGVMTAISGLFAMSVKEKARDPDDPPRHGLEAAWEWVREKPLAIAGAGYMVSTLCHAASTTLAWNYADNDRRKSVPFRAVFVAANLVAELLLAISSKGHGQGVVSDTSVDDSAVAIAADLIVKQPRKMQDHLIEYMGEFLGRQDVLAIGTEEAINKLRHQVEAMRSNPWAQVAGAAAKPLVTPAPDMAAAPLWQAKLAAREAAATPMQLSS